MKIQEELNIKVLVDLVISLTAGMPAKNELRRISFFFLFLHFCFCVTLENKNAYVHYIVVFMEIYLHVTILKSENINMIMRKELSRTISPSFKKEICR